MSLKEKEYFTIEKISAEDYSICGTLGAKGIHCIETIGTKELWFETMGIKEIHCIETGTK